MQIYKSCSVSLKSSKESPSSSAGPSFVPATLLSLTCNPFPGLCLCGDYAPSFGCHSLPSVWLACLVLSTLWSLNRPSVLHGVF